MRMPEDVQGTRFIDMEEPLDPLELELGERLRQRMALEIEHREIAAAIGVSDMEMLRTLREMGFTRATVRILYLVPLIQMAWAEESVSRDERELITEIARLRHITPDTAAYVHLTEMLDRRPSEAFFARSLRLIRAMLQALPVEQQGATRRNLLDYCRQVAEVSGSLSGAGNPGERVCQQEKDLLERLMAELVHPPERNTEEVLAEV
ncbi:MAG: hypothetical protein ACKV2V_15685 [Blastocatellia bacterium]